MWSHTYSGLFVGLQSTKVRTYLRGDHTTTPKDPLQTEPQPQIICSSKANYFTMAATKAPAPPTLGLKDLYLILYNALCCLGWAYVLALGVPSLITSVSTATSSGTSLVDALKDAGANLYFATPSTAGWSDESSPSLAFVLTIVQSAAILEVVHAALGLVRSPVFVTMMQVGSRIVALHMVKTCPKAQCKCEY